MTVYRGWPHTSDGKQILLHNMFPGNVTVNFTGCGGDVAAGTKLRGSDFELSSSAIEPVSLEWQFVEWIYLAGGMIEYMGAKLGDSLTYEVSAPASIGTSNPGAGAYDKVELAPSSGQYTYVPNPTNEGDWDLDLEEMLNVNVGFTKLVPVPNATEAGRFDYDETTNRLSVNSAGKGKYDLYDFQVRLSEFTSRVKLLGAGEIQLTVPAVKPKKILPHWIHKVTVDHKHTDTIDVVWSLFTARTSTV